MTSPTTTALSLKDFTDRVAQIHGTEDWCVWLYALVKMQRPKTVLELGSGTFATSLWIGQGLKENGAGQIWTVDDGRHWPELFARHESTFAPDERHAEYRRYAAWVIARFNLTDQVLWSEQSMPPFPRTDQPLELLFADFQHSPDKILDLMAFYLPLLAEAGSLFFDSVSTHFASYALLELIVPLLNTGKIPGMLWERIEPESREGVSRWVRMRSFQLVHIVEAKHRRQNSTAWLRFWPADVRPWPAAPFH